jgi:nitronate monooxygenase
MMDLGYAGVQLGTRFIATTECLAHQDYKQTIAPSQRTSSSRAASHLPVAVINNAYIKRPNATRFIARFMADIAK